MLREMDETTDVLGALVRRHRDGEAVGITSVCSAHPLVLEAAMALAGAGGDGAGAAPVLVEATSNQVDQTGGYTGMRPAQFRELVLAIAARHGVPAACVLFGGDHLGPNRWRERPAAEAMAHAEQLIAAYVRAGFTKLHLDCSMACADDPPVPGGAAEALGELVPTSAADARATVQAHRAAVAALGLSSAWPRVRALVVQPGVEFDEWSIADYRPERTLDLQRVLDDEPGMVFEAHSTDYQAPGALAALVRDHWAVLKVGPALTFALREALFSLAAIEDELVAPASRSRLPEVLEARMQAEPGHWARYYAGDATEQRLARRYSYSDRARYYWPDPEVHAAQARLLANLAQLTMPLPLLAQHLPHEYARVREGRLQATPRALVLDHIAAVLRGYQRACSPAATRR